MNSKKQLPMSPLLREKSVKSGAIAALAPEAGSCSRQDGNLEIGQYIGKDERTVCERYLGLTVDTGKIIKLGEALTLLFVLIRKCSAGDCCVSNYAALAEECRVSASTIKGWGNKLEQMGFIRKQINGPHGLTFTLIDEGIGRSDLFQRIDLQLCQSAEQIKATMVVVENACKQALASLPFKTENVS